MPLFLGLFSWLLAGLVIALLSLTLLPGKPRLTPGSTLALGLVGAMAGGLLATALGFGGLMGFDPRALITATLGAALAMLALRYRTLPG